MNDTQPGQQWASTLMASIIFGLNFSSPYTYQTGHQYSHIENADYCFHVNKKACDRRNRADIAVAQRRQGNVAVIRHIRKIFIPGQLFQASECSVKRLREQQLAERPDQAHEQVDADSADNLVHVNRACKQDLPGGLPGCPCIETYQDQQVGVMQTGCIQ